MKNMRRRGNVIIDVLLIDKTGFSESSDYFEQIAQEVFTTVEVSFEEAEISVLLTDDDEIADLNEEYRDKEGTTDVLSFPMSDDPLADGGSSG
jgi:probable rRNA maturation factor